MKVCVLGTGAYGIALALTLNANGHSVYMWTKFKEEADYLNKTRISPNLKNIVIDSNIKISTDLDDSINQAHLIIIAVPAGVVDDVSKLLVDKIKPYMHICIASKGIEQSTCLFVFDVVKKYINSDNISVISGPTFAIDIARRAPVGLSLASNNKQTIKVVKQAFENNYVKLRETDDILGIEICGSIKNVIAIAAGILDGMDLPSSTQAMLITESLNDIKELIDNLGGNKMTILSFAGFGDLLLTCTSSKSRNFTFGKMIGSKCPKKEIEDYIKTTTIEGLYTLKSIYKLIKDKQVHMPIIDLINDIIYNDKPASELLTFLITKQ